MGVDSGIICKFRIFSYPVLHVKSGVENKDYYLFGSFWRAIVLSSSLVIMPDCESVTRWKLSLRALLSIWGANRI